MESNYFQAKKEKAEKFFDKNRSAYNPYLRSQIILNSDGFHHLQFSARRERNKEEQLLKFSLLPLALDIIKKSGTVQEYRKELIIVGKRQSDGLAKTKIAQYWGFAAIVGNSQIKIKVILRQIGDGNVIFWSVMPVGKLKDGQKLYTEGIEDN